MIKKSQVIRKLKLINQVQVPQVKLQINFFTKKYQERAEKRKHRAVEAKQQVKKHRSHSRLPRQNKQETGETPQGGPHKPLVVGEIAIVVQQGNYRIISDLSCHFFVERHGLRGLDPVGELVLHEGEAEERKFKRERPRHDRDDLPLVLPLLKKADGQQGRCQEPFCI